MSMFLSSVLVAGKKARKNLWPAGIPTSWRSSAKLWLVGSVLLQLLGTSCAQVLETPPPGGVRGPRQRPPATANKAFTGRTLSKEWPENNPWWHNVNTGFQHMKAHWVNTFLHTLCMGVSDSDWEACHDCYFHADLPSASETYLDDFLKCAKEYKLSEHFKPCQELAEAKDLQIEIDNTLITLSPMEKNSRGRMVIRCLKVTATGTAAISCIKKIIEVQETTMEKLDLYDFFLLGQCFSLENEMSMDKTLIPNLAVPNRYGEYVDYGVRFYNTLYYKSTPEQEALKKKALLLRMLLHLCPAPKQFQEEEMVHLLSSSNNDM